jgi:uncharacterized protein (TIGR02246 family)
MSLSFEHVMAQNAVRSADEQALHGLLEQLLDGWNQEDADKFASPFAEDGSFVAFDGTRLDGRAQIAEFHRPLFKTHLKGMRLSGFVDQCRFVAPDVAILQSLGSTALRAHEAPAAHRDSVQTLVCLKQRGKWAIAAFQNTRLRPIGPGRSFLAWVIADVAWRWLGVRRGSVMQMSGPPSSS